MGLLFWTFGFIAYDAFVEGRDPIPYPSIADVSWIAFCPPVYVGLLLLLRVRVRRLPASFWFQGPIALFGVAAIVAALLFEPIKQSTGGDVATLVTTLAYPIGDLITLAFVLTIFVVTGGRPGRGPALVIVAFAIEFPADIAYLFQTSSGTYEDGGLLDTAWPAVTLLIAHAAWQPRPQTRRSGLGAALLVLPIGFAVTSLGLLIYGNVAELSTPGVVLAILTLVTAVVYGAETAIESAGLRRLARADSLTGLLNHGAFHAALHEELAGGGAGPDAAAAVILFDLDKFKVINDTHGHAGDRVLRQAAAALSDACRREDRAARLGGDEFALLVSDCPAHDARTIASRVQATVAQLGNGVGISFGIAVSPR